MKDLPSDPPIWTPPPEQWFLRHEHAGELQMTAVAKTLSAMWQTVLHTLALPLPTKQKVFGPVEQEAFRKHFLKLGAAGIMPAWRDACLSLNIGDDPAESFQRLLMAKEWGNG